MARTIKSIIFQLGVDRGLGFGEYVDIKGIGTVCTDNFGEYGTITSKVEQYEEAVSEALENEMNARQYSPFEFTAHDLNELDAEDSRPYDVWAVYEDGIYKGICQEVTRRMKAGL
jgi:hypothetical protein